MPILINIALILIGLILLIKGGDYLVKGAVAIANRFKLSPMVIGLTIVAFGTSAPEFLVSLQAAINGSSGIALGNVVGSNIANIALILGATALIAPAMVQRNTLRIDMPFLVFANLLLVAAALTGTILRWHGIVGLLLLIIFITWQIRHTRKHASAEAAPTDSPMHLGWASLMVVLSCVALTYGADWLVQGASGIAMQIGSSLGIAQSQMERIVGLTIVAVGTSCPELFASVIAARKGETDMAIGNVIGSNIFNILCVLGASATIQPIAHAAEGFISDYCWMVALTLLLWLQLRTGHRLSRTEGILLLSLYGGFIAMTLLS